MRVSHFWRSEERHELFTSPLSWLGRKKGRMREEERKRKGGGAEVGSRRMGEGKEKVAPKNEFVGFSL